MSSCALLFLATISLFLAPNDRASTETLVVEGWVRKYAINAAALEYANGGYLCVFVTGGPVVGLGGYINDFQTAAGVGYERLIDAGLPRESVQMVPSRELDRDRTYSSALALRRWFAANGIEVRSLNVLTESLHARRTRLLYQKAFGPDVRIGVIGVASPDYPPREWYRYSEGVKDVVAETFAYLYVRLFFWPEPPQLEGQSASSRRP